MLKQTLLKVRNMPPTSVYRNGKQDALVSRQDLQEDAVLLPTVAVPLRLLKMLWAILSTCMSAGEMKTSKIVILLNFFFNVIRTL